MKLTKLTKKWGFDRTQTEVVQVECRREVFGYFCHVRMQAECESGEDLHFLALDRGQSVCA